MRTASPRLTPDLLLWAYSQGFFPMASGRRGRVGWHDPDPRAILPLETFHVPHTLRRRVRSDSYDIRFDTAFACVIRACAEPRSYQRETWINDEIIDAYTELHHNGHAHSVEAWTRDDEPKLVGGLYGVSIGAAFFGESMFCRATDASKVCLVHLVERLRARKFLLLDTQISNPHMAQFGVIEIPRAEYREALTRALARKTSFV